MARAYPTFEAVVLQAGLKGMQDDCPPVKRELSQEAPPDAAVVKLEPVGLKLEQVEEKETAVDDMEMEEVLCEEEPLPARAQPLPARAVHPGRMLLRSNDRTPGPVESKFH